MPFRPHARRAVFTGLALAAGLAGLAVACQDPAGLPPTLEPGLVSFSFQGPMSGSGTFVADGRCYSSRGQPPADSACAVAVDLGDTLRLRAVRHPRTIRWQHVNVDVPVGASCEGGDACGIAFDMLNRAGVVEQSFRSMESVVTVIEETEGRMRGTFSGKAYRVGGRAGDTLRIEGGTFDVPVER